MPLFSPYGEIVAFTSRNPNAPKRYQHWHESFDKTNYLYGLDVAKDHIRKWKKAIIVEGQFDTAYLHTAGFNMTVGLCGTAFSVMHAAILGRYCSEIYLLLDPDESGDNCVIRAKNIEREYHLNKCGMNILVLRLPPAKDPDDFVYENGQQALIKLMRDCKERNTNG